MSERKTRTINSEKSINVKLGQNTEQWKLPKIEDKYRDSNEWGKVQSFYCIPNLEKRDPNLKLECYKSNDDLENEIVNKFEELFRSLGIKVQYNAAIDI